MSVTPVQPRGKGRFIAVEGIDGAGTTTLVGALAERLRLRGWSVLTTREPSDGPIGVLVRQALAGRLVGRRPAEGAPNPLAPAALALLFAADRIDHLDVEIGPALQAGRLVLSDRYVLSSLAYQAVELPLAWVRAINERARPADLTLFLRVDVDTALSRLFARGNRRELYERRSFLERVAQRYEEAVRQTPGGATVLDGTAPPDEVLEAAWGHVERLLDGAGADSGGDDDGG